MQRGVARRLVVQLGRDLHVRDAVREGWGAQGLLLFVRAYVRVTPRREGVCLYSLQLLRRNLLYSLLYRFTAALATAQVWGPGGGRGQVRRRFGARGGRARATRTPGRARNQGLDGALYAGARHAGACARRARPTRVLVGPILLAG